MTYEVKLMYGEQVNNVVVCYTKAEIKTAIETWKRLYRHGFEKCSVQIYPAPNKDVNLDFLIKKSVDKQISKGADFMNSSWKNGKIDLYC